MKRLYLPLIALLLISLEGVAAAVLPEQFLKGNALLIPHWGLLFFVLIAMLYDLDNTYYSLLYALLFGLLKDVIYTDILGVYMFTYGLSIYLILELRRVLHANVLVAVVLGIAGIIAADLSMYGLYYMIGTTTETFMDYLMHRLLPTLAANSVMMIILYNMLKRPLEKWSSSQLRRTTSL